VTSAASPRRRIAIGSTFTLYAVLGVTPDAEPETIRNAYRELARRFHPDAGGDARYMAAINKAWGELRDPERRAAYDRKMHLERPVTVSAAPPDDPATATSASAHADVAPAPTPAAPREKSSSGTVLDFGRYEGWTIGQLASRDPEYLLWLERTPIGRPLRAEIEAALAARR
jgi:curved DNA-binding protein CbpA